MKPLLWGMLCGALVGALGVGLAMSFLVRERVDSAQAEWAPAEVLVAMRVLHPGEVVRPADLAVTRVPVQFVSPSMVSPADIQHVVGRAVQVEVSEDDVLTWSTFASRARGEELKRCVEAAQPRVAAVGAEAATQVIAETGRRSPRSLRIAALEEPRRMLIPSSSAAHERFKIPPPPASRQRGRDSSSSASPPEGAATSLARGSVTRS